MGNIAGCQNTEILGNGPGSQLDIYVLEHL